MTGEECKEANQLKGNVEVVNAWDFFVLPWYSFMIITAQ
jgi:hypothetical protein